MSLFDNLVGIADGVVTAVMSTRAELLPLLPARLALPSPDPSRPAFMVDGVFTDQPDDEVLQGQRQGSGSEFKGTTALAAASRSLWLSAAEAARPGYALRKGDAVRLLDKPGQPVFAIVRVDITDHGDVTLILTAEAQP